LEKLPHAEICFNYLGQMDGSVDGTGLFTLSDDPVGRSRSPQTKRSWLLEVNAAVVSRKLRLQVTYNTTIHDRSEIEAFAAAFRDALGAIIDCCTQQQKTRHTPSDFALAGLEQDDLDKLAGLLEE
jgi:non-ribosomal peptide synthase protein (TIGR01720 family)